MPIRTRLSAAAASARVPTCIAPFPPAAPCRALGQTRGYSRTVVYRIMRQTTGPPIVNRVQRHSEHRRCRRRGCTPPARGRRRSRLSGLDCSPASRPDPPTQKFLRVCMKIIGRDVRLISARIKVKLWPRQSEKLFAKKKEERWIFH